MVEVGERAPDFTLKNQDDVYVSLSDFKGKKVVIFFYPKDMTSGCTKEACSFKNSYNEIKEQNIEVLGISQDNTDSHQKFIDKEELPFTLLCDEEAEVAKAYGAYGAKAPGKKTAQGIVRKTFLVAENGEIAFIFDEVDPEFHAEEVLDVWNTL